MNWTTAQGPFQPQLLPSLKPKVLDVSEQTDGTVMGVTPEAAEVTLLALGAGAGPWDYKQRQAGSPPSKSWGHSHRL